MREALGTRCDRRFGLSLPSGDVLSCFTLHAFQTFSMPSGSLQQDAAQSQWGHQLAPGSYASITYDYAEPPCDAGSGTDGVAGNFRFGDTFRIVGTTGVPL